MAKFVQFQDATNNTEIFINVDKVKKALAGPDGGTVVVLDDDTSILVVGSPEEVARKMNA